MVEMQVGKAELYALNLQNQFNNMATEKFKNNPIDEKGYESLRNFIDELTDHKADLIITVKSKLKCSNRKHSLLDKDGKKICKEKAKYDLPCKHSLCEACFERQIGDVLGNEGIEELIENTICPKCEENIPVEFIYGVLGKERVDEIYKEHLKPCIFCKLSHPAKDMIELECGHIVAKFCIKQLLDSAINLGASSGTSFECPVEGCHKTFSPSMVSQIIGPKEYEKISFKKALDIKAINGEILIICPEPNCGCVFLAQIKGNEYECPACLKKKCSVCKKDPHPLYSCKPQRDFERESIMILNKIKDCQTCGNPVSRIDGCNYIKCGGCVEKFGEGKFGVCYHCGIKLINARDHLPHFLGDVFGMHCRYKC